MPVLINQDIWLAYPCLIKLLKCQFPVNVSISIAKLMGALEKPYWAIEAKRVQLVKKYGTLKGDLFIIPSDSEKAGDFAVASSELLMQEWGNLEIEKVKLPQKITSKCEKCGHTTEILFQIEPNLLVPLTELFVEIV